MQKKTLTIIGAVIAVAAAGGVGAWWVTTENTKKEVVATIERLNAMELPEGITMKIGYESVKASGLPPVITVRLVNPTFDLTMPLQPATQPMMHDGEDVPVPAAQTLTMKVSYDGYADVITNHLGASYGLKIAGDDTIATTAGDKSVTIKGDDSAYKISVTADSIQDFMRWEKMNWENEEDVKNFVRSLREFALTSGKLEYKDVATGEPALTQDGADLTFLNRSKGEVYDFDLDFSARNMKVHSNYGAVLDHITALQDPTMGAAPFSATRAGVQNMEGKVSFYFTEDEAAKKRTLKLDVPKMSYSSDYYDFTSPLKLDLQEADDTIRFDLKADYVMTMKAAGSAEMKSFLANTIKAFEAMLPPPASTGTASMTDQVFALVPTISTLGPVTTALEVSGDVASPKSATPGKGMIDLKRFEISHQRWAIKADGKVDNKTQTPNVNLTLRCEKCDQFTADTMDQAVKAENFGKTMGSEGFPVTLGQPLLDAINTLLATVGKKDEAGTVVLAITTPAANDFRLNDQPIANVMMQAMTTLMPFMKQPGVPAAQPDAGHVQVPPPVVPPAAQ